MILEKYFKREKSFLRKLSIFYSNSDYITRKAYLQDPFVRNESSLKDIVLIGFLG